MKVTQQILIVSILILPLMASANQDESQSALIQISQNGTQKISTSDRSKISTEVFTVRTQKEMEILERNKKRLSLYQKKLALYNPPKGEIEILVTGYSSTPDQTWGDPFTTASGTHVHSRTMACPPQYPFGTKVQIEGRGTYICEDRGGKIKGNHFDMWFPSRHEALNWGKRVVIATIEK